MSTKLKWILGFVVLSLVAGEWWFWKSMREDRSEESLSPVVHEKTLSHEGPQGASTPLLSLPDRLPEETGSLPAAANQPAECTPNLTSCPSGYSCGHMDAGCGQEIICGMCDAGETCIDHRCASLPEASSTPSTAEPYLGPRPAVGLQLPKRIPLQFRDGANPLANPLMMNGGVNQMTPKMNLVPPKE